MPGDRFKLPGRSAGTDRGAPASPFGPAAAERDRIVDRVGSCMRLGDGRPILDDLAPAALATMLVVAGDGRADPLLVGEEFQVNSYTTRTQYSPGVAFTTGGDFVVAWGDSYRDPDDSAGIFAQRFARDPFEGFPCSEAGVGIPAVEIPDGDVNGIADDLEVSAGGRAFDLAVYLDIEHSFVGDLAVTLTKQSTGTAVTLVDRPGVPGLGSLGCSGDDMAIELRDDAETSVEDECGDPDAYPGSVYAPVEPLAAFDGETLAGTWRLELSDSASVDSGVLRRWCLLPRTLFADDFESGDALAWSASVP